MRIVWGCFPAARLRWPANATWLSWPLWAKTVRTSARSATSVSCIWKHSSTCLSRWYVWEAKRQRTGQKRRGKVPKPVEDAPADNAQSNFTDPELHIMQTNNKGWEYCGNAQVSVDATCQIILACDVTDASNDKQQGEPVAQATLATLAQAGIALPKDESGAAQAIPATLDNGYYR